MDKQTQNELQILGTDALTICWNKLQTMYKGLGSQPIIKINNRFKTTGGVCKADVRVIELSAELFYYNQEEFVKVTIPHEAIHQVDWDIYNNCGHGPTWKKVMVEYGLTPDRCHDMINPLQVKRQFAKRK